MRLAGLTPLRLSTRKLGEMADFAETVAVNRGMPVATFNDLGDAEEWIARQDDDSDSQRIFRGSDLNHL